MDSEFTFNYSKGRRGDKITHIVITTPLNTYKAALEWYKNTASRESSHYLIGKRGQQCQLVKEENTAWGPKGCTTFSIIVSLADATSGLHKDGKPKQLNCINNQKWADAEQMKDAAVLVAKLMVQYDIPIENVVGADSNYCKKLGSQARSPGRYFRWADFRFLIQHELSATGA